MDRGKKAVIALACASFVSCLYAATQTLLAYIGVSYPDVASTSVTSLLSVPSLASVPASIIVGILAVKLDKKKLLLVFMIFGAIHMGIFAVVGSNGPFAMLMLASIFAGVWCGSYISLQGGLINDYVAPEKSASTFALLSATMNGGMALGNIVFGAVGSKNGGANWSHPYYIGVVLFVLFIAAVVIMMPKAAKGIAEDSDKKEKESLSLKGWNPCRVILLTLLSMIVSMGVCGFSYNVSSYIVTEYQLGTGAEVGIASALMTVSGVVTGMTFAFWQKLFKRWIATCGFIFMIIGFVAMRFVTGSLLGIFATAILVGLGSNLANPFIMSKIMANSPPRLVSLVISISSAVINMALFALPYIHSVVGPMLGGGIAGVVMATMVILCVALILSVVVFSRKEETAKVEN